MTTTRETLLALRAEALRIVDSWDTMSDGAQHRIDEWAAKMEAAALALEAVAELRQAVERPKSERRPHTCPVCTGRGLVHRPHGGDVLAPGGGSLIEPTTTKCPACAGAGIVWEPE